MLTLYTGPGTAGLVVHWLLLELDVPFELKLLDMEAKEHKQPEYLKLNPGGVVPTLLVDGQPLCEAAAMLLYLADRYPARGFAPPPDSPQRAAYLQWIVHLANTLQPLFRMWFYPGEVLDDAAIAAVKEKLRPRIEAVWELLDARAAGASPYLLGAQPSAADLYLTMLMRWSRNMPEPATSWPNLARLATVMKARPSFRALYAREGLTEWA